MNKFAGATWRCVASVILFVIQIITNNFWRVASGSVESASAADQLSNDSVAYVSSGFIADGTIGTICWGIFVILFLIIWVPYLTRVIQYDNDDEVNE
jgi:hypothetical protein